jgi:hypothetical protein
MVSDADPDPRSGAFLTPGSVIRDGQQNQDPNPGSVMNIPDHISVSLETIFGLKILQFFDADADPDPGSGIFLILDPGWKHSDPGWSWPS